MVIHFGRTMSRGPGSIRALSVVRLLAMSGVKDLDAEKRSVAVAARPICASTPAPSSTKRMPAKPTADLENASPPPQSCPERRSDANADKSRYASSDIALTSRSPIATRALTKVCALMPARPKRSGMRNAHRPRGTVQTLQHRSGRRQTVRVPPAKPFPQTYRAAYFRQRLKRADFSRL